MFKRIFWNNPTEVAVTLNAYVCLQGGGGGGGRGLRGEGSWVKNWS